MAKTPRARKTPLGRFMVVRHDGQWYIIELTRRNGHQPIMSDTGKGPAYYPSHRSAYFDALRLESAWEMAEDARLRR